MLFEFNLIPYFRNVDLFENIMMLLPPNNMLTTERDWATSDWTNGQHVVPTERNFRFYPSTPFPEDSLSTNNRLVGEWRTICYNKVKKS